MLIVFPADSIVLVNLLYKVVTPSLYRGWAEFVFITSAPSLLLASLSKCMYYYHLYAFLVAMSAVSSIMPRPPYDQLGYRNKA
jgi:hypothetical protein